MITSYAALKSTVADFLARDDLTTKIPVFVQLAEAEMSRLLNTREQERRVQATVRAGVRHINMPQDLREFRMIRLTSPKEAVLDFLPLDLVETDFADQQGTPSCYTIDGDDNRLAPIPSAEITVEMVYVENVPTLSDASPTNRMLLRNPDVYLHGTLKHAHSYLLDEARAQYHAALFTQGMAGVAQDAESSRFGRGPLTIQLR